MTTVTVRQLRNESADVLARVNAGETLTVTRDGAPVAAIIPLPRRPATAEQLIARRDRLPRMAADALRADIDAFLDPRL